MACITLHVVNPVTSNAQAVVIESDYSCVQGVMQYMLAGH